MAAIPIRPDLQKRRVRIFADRFHDFGQLVAHFAKVHAVDNFTGNIVTFCAIDDLLERCRSFHRRAHGKEIVFANQDNRQFVKRDEIERFVKRALIDRAIAEKAKGHPIFATVL